MITLSYINFWTDPYNDNYFTEFIQYNIGSVQIVPYYNNPDILIVSVFGDINIIKNINAKCKLFYYGENLNTHSQYNNEQLLIDTFDLIVGFKNTNLEKKHIRFPLWLIYYKFYNYTTDNNLINYIEHKYKINNIKNKNKTLFATLVSRHDIEGQRTKICNEVDKYIKNNTTNTTTTNYKIMYPGLFRNNIGHTIGSSLEDKINYIAQSIYNICPENSSFEGYFTEKIFQAFEGGTIPLYWAIDLPEKGLINENKYCFCNVNNSNENNTLQEQINKAMTHPDYYLEGNVFTEEASIILSNYYNTLISNIKIKLNK